ncbi:hypothetical protein QL093DRAFT_2213196 [Fusarium oxysporum]|nr:hypothetical protein QL093DRAFT_2548549 [Fusarium oxysporum]KAJ9414777.1 hypothetical protein QL093DRAFT_2447828 [Fusarium oxysporum]KAJ9424351.1 hypothetical protein QL093DRAFT_2213196 [Fusarium oxysporum]
MSGHVLVIPWSTWLIGWMMARGWTSKTGKIRRQTFVPTTTHAPEMPRSKGCSDQSSCILNFWPLINVMHSVGER